MTVNYTKRFGVRFYPSGFKKIQSETSLFDYLFRDVYDDFKNLFVLCDSIWMPDKEDDPVLFGQLNSKVVISLRDPVCFQGSVLPLYGPGMPEFEGGNILLVETEPKISSWREFELFESDQFDMVHTIISNFDGAFWEIYSRDHNVVNRLVEKHCCDEMLELFDVDYELDNRAFPIRHYSELKNCRIQRKV